MGTLLIAVGVFDSISLSAALYYLVHSTLAASSLFLIADLVVERRGRYLGRLVPSPAFRSERLLAGLYFLAALATAGMPPLSGFIGKLLILDATRASPQSAAIWTTVLVTSLLLIAGFARAGSVLFWKRREGSLAAVKLDGTRTIPVAVVAAMLGLTAALAVFAGPVMDEMNLAVDQLLEPARYVRAVLGTQTALLGAGG